MNDPAKPDQIYAGTPRQCPECGARAMFYHAPNSMEFGGYGCSNCEYFEPNNEEPPQ